MLEIVSVTLPYFALILCGYVARGTGVMVEGSAKALNGFVLYFALPAMMIRAIGAIPFQDVLNVEFAIAWAVISIALFAGVIAVSMLLFREGGAAATVRAAASSHGNIGYLGLTLVIGLMGEVAAGPVAMAIVFDMMILIPVSIALLEFFGKETGGGLAQTLRAAVLNPFVVSIVAGLGLSLSGATLPGPADDFLRILGMAAVPAALFAIGVTLYAQPMRAAAGELTAICLVKLLLHPLVVIMVATSEIFDLSREEVAIAVLLSALPVANNVFLVATRYDVRPNRISGAILFSTSLALITFNLWAWLLLTE
ncbi:MAG: AEC family transporter [Pseudomonadota bacterium]